MKSTMFRWLVILFLTVQWLATEGCMWCDPKMTSRFTNCLFLEIVSDSSLDVLERDLLLDMKSSLYSASRSISKSSGPMKENIMNGALAGEVSGMVASHSAATGQDPAVATAEVMKLIGRCYFSVTGQSEVHFVKTLRKAVEDLVVDEMNDYDDGSGGSSPPQNPPNGRDVASQELLPNPPPNSQQSAFPARNSNPAPRMTSGEINTSYNVDESPQSNGIPPRPDNAPLYPPRTNQGNYGAEAFASSNTGFNDGARNDGIQPFAGNLPSRTNDNAPVISNAGVPPENLSYNRPFYAPTGNRPPPSNSNVPPSSTGILLPPASRPSDAKLPFANRNFQDSGVRQLNQNSLAIPPPQQNRGNQAPPAVFQGSEVSFNKFSSIPAPSVDKQFRQFQEPSPSLAINFGPNNNGFVYPIKDKNLNNQSPPSETRVSENKGNQFPLPFPNMENKSVGSGLGPQSPNILPNNGNNNAPANVFSGQTLVADSLNKDMYPSYQSKSFSSTNQNSGFPNGNFQGFVNGNRNQYVDSSVSNQYDYQNDAVSVKNPTLSNQTPNQPSKGLEIPPWDNNYNFNPVTGTQQLSSSNFNSPAAQRDNQNFPLKQPLPENKPNNGQAQNTVGQNVWNFNVPTSNFEGMPKLQPGSSKTNSREPYLVNENENCAKTFYQTLIGKLLETNELSSILGTNSIPLLVKDSAAEATRRTFIDIGYSAYSDEVSNYCAIQIASLNERSGTQAYAEKITKSVTDVLLKNNATVGNCADGAKSIALHILRWLEVFFKSDGDNYNPNSSSTSSSSSSANSVSQSNDSSSNYNNGASDSSSQDNFYDYDFSDYDCEECDEDDDDDEQQDSSLQDTNANGGDDDCEDQEPESSSSPNEDCDDEQETTSSNEDEDCDDEQESSSPNENDDEDCDDEQSESSSQQDSENNVNSNVEYSDDEQSETSSQQDDTNSDNSNDEYSDATSASDQQKDRKESELSNYESKYQIDLLMSSARLSMSPSGFNLPGFVSVMASVADQMGIDHPDWNSNKVQVKTFTQTLTALTLLLQELAYPNSK